MLFMLYILDLAIGHLQDLTPISRGAISSIFFLISLLLLTSKGAIELGEQKSGIIFFCQIRVYGLSLRSKVTRFFIDTTK